MTTGLDLDGDTITVDRPVGLPPTVGRGDVQNQLNVTNAYRATLNLPGFTDARQIQWGARYSF